MSIDNVLEKLFSSIKGKILILGIGNMLKGDDAFGSVLAKRLKDKLNSITVIDAEETPENYLLSIKKHKPDTIILVDALFCGLKPGEIKIFRPSDIINMSIFFTHNTSLDVMMNFLKEETHAEIFLIGVHPKEIMIKEGLSREALETLERIENWFLELDNVLCHSR